MLENIMTLPHALGLAILGVLVIAWTYDSTRKVHK